MLNPNNYEGVIKFVLGKWSLPRDRFYDIGWEGLIESCNKFDETKANTIKPQTYLIKGVEIYIGSYIEDDLRWRGFIKTSGVHHYIWFLQNYRWLIYKAKSLDDMEEIGQELSYNKDDFNNFEVYNFIETKLNDKEKLICQYRLDGYTEQEIGELLDFSRQRVNQYMNKIREKMIKYFGKEKCAGRKIKKYEKSKRMMKD